jgi:spermidine/putrescine transport system ATP-binding protein
MCGAAAKLIAAGELQANASPSVQEFLAIDHVSKAFGALRAVDGVSLEIGRGEVFSLLGPSGCGKTTLLRMLAGFEQPDSGSIRLDGQDITSLPPDRRPVNTVFQNYALFPHLSVWENIAFGLKMAGRGRAEIKAAVERMLTLTRLEEQARKRPAQLSGGQKQRVAIARALVNEPQVLLLDEPLAALDLKLRQHMLSELNSLHREVGTTFIYVTHDQGEALSLSDRIAVMNAGRVEQIATPRTLYESPASAFVAGFIGDANFFPAIVQEMMPGGFVRVQMDGLGRPAVMSALDLKHGDAVRVMVRPENLQLSVERLPAQDRANAFQSVVEEVIYFGAHERVRLRAGMQVLHTHRSRSEGLTTLKPGDDCWVTFQPEACRVVGAGG